MIKERNKRFILCLLVIGVSFLFWWRLYLFLMGPSLVRLVFVTIFAFALLCASVIFMLLIKSLNVFYTTYLISSFSFFAFFQGQGHELKLYIIAILLFFGFFVLGYEFIQHEKKERIHLSYVRIWKRGLPFLIIGLSLVIALVYYFNPLLKIGQKKIEIPKVFFSTIMQPLKIVFKPIIPFYTPGMTIDEMIVLSQDLDYSQILSNLSLKQKQILKSSLEAKNLSQIDLKELAEDSNFVQILKENVSSFDENVLSLKRQEIGETFNIKVDGNETMDLIVTRVINSKLSDFIGPYSEEISIGIAIALFFLLEFIGKIMSIFVIMLSSLFVKFLISLNLVKKTKKIKTQYFLEL